MDIYILHKGQESGPYSEKAVAHLLDQGSIAPSDFAWRQGWPDWRPVSEVLAASATTAPETPNAPKDEAIAKSDEKAPKESKEVAKEPKERTDSPVSEKAESATTPAKSADSSEPATAKQKALLTFLRITVPSQLSKDQASGLINDAMEDPKHAARLTQWNEERLRLHPELFAAEMQAKKENRANHFFELCQTKGAEYFNGISRAHCQVLVSFLDVKFPHWGTPETDAAEHYFFPAVAEKFPQLVQKQWRNRLRYVDGGKVASEIVQKSATSKMHPARTTPAAAIGRGLVIGFVILGALYLGQRTLQRQANAATAVEEAPAAGPSSASSVPAATASADPATAPSAAPAPALPLATAPAPALAPATSESPALPLSAPASPAPAPLAATTPLSPPSAAPGDAPGMAPMAPASMAPSTEPVAPVPPPPPTLPVAGTLPTAPAAPMASTDLTPPVLGPDPTGMSPIPAPSTGSSPTPGITPPPAPPAMTTTAAARINLLLTKPVEVQLTYGKIMLPPGTPVKLMARQGTTLRVSYQNSVIIVPVSSTDLE